MNETKQIKLVLQVAHFNGDIEELLNRGVKPFDIARIIYQSRKEELLTVDENQNLVLTDKGFQFLSRITNAARRGDPRLWISPADHRRIDKADVNTVYIPPVAIVHKLFDS